MATVTVTRFKPDDAHVNLEKIGQITTETQKAASLMATKLSDQEMKKGDISVETNEKLAKAVADAKKKCGFVGEYVEGAKDKLSTVKSQAKDIQGYAQKLYEGGKGAYKTYYSDPVNYIKSTKNSVLAQVRSIAGIRFKIDDLLIGEDARRLLMMGIQSVCGKGGLGFDGMYGAWKSLLDILDNINLFDNSALWKAIANCDRFTDDHVRVVSSKTSLVAAQGKTETYLEMVKIPDVTSTEGDIITLCDKSADNAIDAQNIILIYNETGRPTSTMVMKEVPSSLVEESVPVLNLEKVSSAGNKEHLIAAVVEDNDYTFSPRALNQATAVMVPRSATIEPHHATIKQNRTLHLEEPIILQNRLVANKTVSSVDKTTNIPGREINKTPIMKADYSRKVSIAAPGSWAEVNAETASPPDFSSFDNITPLDEVKLTTGSMMVTADLDTVVKEPKNPYDGLTLLPFGVKTGLSPKPIKSWKIVKDSNGRELRIPIFS